MTWINVFHAIPGKFNLQDLPRSPPSTPGPAIGGEDYFTEKVFDSAVSIADYQQDLSELPRSPCPVVSITEQIPCCETIAERSITLRDSS